MREDRGIYGTSMVIFAAWFVVWSNVICNVRSEKATVACSLSGTNNQNLRMSLSIVKENDVISMMSVYTARENDPTLSRLINDEGCQVTGNGELATPFSITVTFDATSDRYPCGIVVTNINEYRLRVRSFEHPGVKSTNDAFFDAVCDRSDGSQTNAVLPRSAFLPAEKDLLRFELFNDRNQQATTVNLGDSVYFKAEYYYNNEYRVGTCGYDFWFALPQDSDSDATFTNYLIISHRQTQPVNTTLVYSNGSENLINFVGEFGFKAAILSIEPHTGSERVTNKSIHIISTHQICVYSFNYLSAQSSTLFSLFPTNYLGRDYVINKLFKDNTVVVLATESNTDISLEGDVTNLDKPFSLSSLEPFESVQVLAKDSLTKLRIVSTKPVAVFVGAKSITDSTDGYAEQIADTTKMGNKFVFPPTFGEIICTSLTPSTVINYICNDGSSVENTIPQYESATFTSSNTHHCLVESSAPLSCGQYFKTAPAGDVKGYASMIPFSQWSTHYSFGTFVNKEYEILIVIEDGFQPDLEIWGYLAGVVNGSTLSWSSVLRHSGISYMGLTFPINIWFGPRVQVSHPSKSFLVLLRDNREISVTIPPKSFMDNVSRCSNTLGFSGDHVDSDCDGSIDEDTALASGSKTYDLKAYPEGTKAAGEIRFTNCIAKSNDIWNDGGPTVTFIDQNGCMVGPESDLFAINSTFSEVTTGKLDYPKLFSSGYLESARFSGSSDVYFRCQVLLCYDYSGECFKDACQVGTGYIGDKYDRMYVDLKVKVLYSNEKPLHSRREVTDSNSSETSIDTFVIICVSSFIPLLLSLAVTLVLYRKLTFLIEETMTQSTDKFKQEPNNLNRL
ncbi:uncharacterized protein LOC133199429 isoform X2 [Saccostrea echinata]|nr:uncharacterized protein LOC133199429 isoform X2 [Saccostrea echinata]